MIVLYRKDNNQFITSVRGFPKMEERSNKLYGEGHTVFINDLSVVGWSLYPDQEIRESKQWDEGVEAWIDAPITVEEINLRGFTQEELDERQKLSRDLYAEMDEVRREIAKVKKT